LIGGFINALIEVNNVETENLDEETGSEDRQELLGALNGIATFRKQSPVVAHKLQSEGFDKVLTADFFQATTSTFIEFMRLVDQTMKGAVTKESGEALVKQADNLVDAWTTAADYLDT